MNMNEYSQPCSPISMNPVLMERQIQRLAEAADTLVKSLPPMDVKPLLNGNKKRINKDIEVSQLAAFYDGSSVICSFLCLTLIGNGRVIFCYMIFYYFIFLLIKKVKWQIV